MSDPMQAMNYGEKMINGRRTSTVQMVKKLTAENLYSRMSIDLGIHREVAKKAAYALALTGMNPMASRVLAQTSHLLLPEAEVVIEKVDGFMEREFRVTPGKATA